MSYASYWRLRAEELQEENRALRGALEVSKSITENDVKRIGELRTQKAALVTQVYDLQSQVARLEAKASDASWEIENHRRAADDADRGTWR